jgi:hypothetical protein
MFFEKEESKLEFKIICISMSMDFVKTELSFWTCHEYIMNYYEYLLNYQDKCYAFTFQN